VRGTGGPLLDGEIRVRRAADVLGLLDGQVAAVLADAQLATGERARLIVGLAGAALRAIEAADLAGRVAALERVLADRGRDAA
jgi:hypothetical protein